MVSECVEIPAIVIMGTVGHGMAALMGTEGVVKTASIVGTGYGYGREQKGYCGRTVISSAGTSQPQGHT